MDQTPITDNKASESPVKAETWETDPEQILAKGVHTGSLSLPEHTRHVVTVIGRFCDGYAYPFEKKIARNGAILHDLGKAHPHFQRKISGRREATLHENNKWNYVHRHEISSLGFLPLFPKAEWHILIDLVVAHHKSIERDPAQKGILDLNQWDSDWIAHHLYEWDRWHFIGLHILQTFDIPTRQIPLEEATKALQYALEHCASKKNGWSPWRGLLRSADHFASAFMMKTETQLVHLFETPDLTYYKDSSRQNELYPLSLLSATDPRKHTMAVASTGSGKTDFLIRRCKGRIYYVLPFQASINAMWKRLRNTIPNKDIRLLHAASKIVMQERPEEQILQPLAGSAVKVLTPHQMAAIIFGTSGFESVMLDIEGCDVILDEIHTYSEYSQAMVLSIIEALLRLNCRIHIGTATIPTVLYNKILQLLGGPSDVYEVRLTDKDLDSFNRHIVFKEPDESRVPEILEEAFNAGERVLLVFNTVKKAQEAYKKLSQKFPLIASMLLHSRFRRMDRVELEERLKTEFNARQGSSPCFVIATQVVEVSLDISFDRMITECAPLDSLVQRIGRINRWRTLENIGRYKPVHVLAPGADHLPYRKEILERSYQQLEHGKLWEERLIQARIDAVYPFLNQKSIDIHLINREGKFALRELTDIKDPVIAQVLEIESCCCILERDRESYLTASFEDRLALEIPAPWKSTGWLKEKYEQLAIGSNPFVIPQPYEEYKIFGLILP